MGMFDSVHAKCPQCGEESEFQSKEGACNLANYHVDSHLTTGIPDAVGKAVYQQASANKGYVVRFVEETVPKLHLYSAGTHIPGLGRAESRPRAACRPNGRADWDPRLG